MVTTDACHRKPALSTSVFQVAASEATRYSAARLSLGIAHHTMSKTTITSEGRQICASTLLAVRRLMDGVIVKTGPPGS